MAAIITNKFRINNAEQFTESFSETAAETYYLFIGRAHSWASDVDVQGNTIAEGTDASPPTPNDDVTSEFYNWDDMLGAKLIASTDVSRVIPRRNWTTGTTYDMYEHNIGSGNAAASGATNLFDSTYVVMNGAFAVYKVIENDGATASTVEPTSTSNSIFATSDGYRWKYMYSLTSAETLNFMSTDFIHASTDSTVSAAAVSGALDTALVVAGGSSYSTGSGATITAMSNPPFGAVKRQKHERGPVYTGADFEFHVIDIASQIAEYGVFIVPQMSAGFEFSGKPCYRRQTSGKAFEFQSKTGMHFEAGCGIDTSIHQKSWRGVDRKSVV